MMQEREGIVTMEGDPLTLLGPELKAGDPAPGFTAVDAEWNEVGLSDMEGEVVLISAVPSVDTSVCSQQTRRFNEEAAKLPEGVSIITISQDLPFALGRFCAAEGIDRIRVVSDHVDADFGMSYGVLIKDMRLLARSVWVVDADGKLAYVQVVPEVTDLPDFDAALAAVRDLTGD